MPDTNTTPALIAAVATLAGMSRDIGEAGGHFTCTEAEALADVLRAAGHDAAAAEFIEGHAAGDDDPDDQHRAQYLAGCGLPEDHDSL